MDLNKINAKVASVLFVPAIIFTVGSGAIVQYQILMGLFGLRDSYSVSLMQAFVGNAIFALVCVTLTCSHDTQEEKVE